MSKNDQSFIAYKHEVGQRLRDLLDRAGLTVADVAREIPGWGYSRLSNYVNGINLPGPNDLRKITTVCGAAGCEQWVYYGEMRSRKPPARKS